MTRPGESAKNREPMTLGFTGTREGMTAAQFHTVAHRLNADRARPRTERLFIEARHGDCLGADEQFHYLALALIGTVEVHPCDIEHLRAYCQRAATVYDPLPPLERNRVIVDRSQETIARLTREREAMGEVVEKAKAFAKALPDDMLVDHGCPWCLRLKHAEDCIYAPLDLALRALSTLTPAKE